MAGESKRILVFFIDALKPDALDKGTTPTLWRLSESGSSRRLRTVLGYSSGIKPTIFAGQYPSTHNKWSKFYWDPEGSPFDGFERYRALDWIRPDIAKRGVKFLTSRFLTPRWGKKKGYSNLRIENVPFEFLPYLDYTDSEEVTELGVGNDLFTLLARHNLPAEYVSLNPALAEQQMAQVVDALQANDVVVTYIYNLDAAGHRFGTTGSAIQATLRQVDSFVSDALEHAREHWGEAFDVFIFSDHGMSDTERFYRPDELLRDIPFEEGQDYHCFVDSTMLRFWYTAEGVRDEVMGSLEARLGSFLTSEDKAANGIAFADDRYGEDVYLLPDDSVFFPSYVSWLKPAGMHGYDCRHPSQDGVFITNLPLTGSEEYMEMVDILPTLLETLNLPIPSTVEGSSQL